MNRYKAKHILTNSFYPLYMLIYFFLMFGISITSYVGFPIVICIVAIVFNLFIKTWHKQSFNIGKRMFVIWAVLNLASIGMYLFNGMPLSCYTYSLQYYFFPMLFFFIGSDETNINDGFYNTFLFASAFFFIVGLYLYFVMPPFYIAYQAEAWGNAWYTGSAGYNEDNIASVLRFSSFMSSSYVASALSISTIAISLGFLFRKSKIKHYFLYTLSLICIIGAILCQQRIAMACVVLVLVVFSIYGRKKGNNFIFGISLCCLFLFISLIGLSFADDRLYVISEMITNRMDSMNFDEAMSGRTGQYIKAYNEILNYFVTGKGMGAGGHAAAMNGNIGVCDGEFIHLFFEFGFIGALIFIPFILMTLKRGITNFNELCVETSIVVYLLLSGIGENVLSVSYLIGPIFWFCAGRIWNNNYLLRLHNEV